MDITIFKLFLLHICVTGMLCQKIIVHPKNVTFMQREDITLRCEFDKPVEECTWNACWDDTCIKLSIAMHYQYFDSTANGRNTRDCSILLTGINHLTKGYYLRCSNARGILESNKAYLTIAKQITVHPKSTTVEEGEDIILECKFYKAVDCCVWFRNGSMVKITDRYRYYNSQLSGIHTNDCSIEITQFSRIDATGWQCSNAFCNFILSSVTSNLANLTIAKPKTMDNSLSYHSNSGEIKSRKISKMASNSGKDKGTFFEVNSSTIPKIIPISTLAIIIITGAIIY